MGLFSRIRDAVALPEDAAQVVLPEPLEPFQGTHGIPVMDPGFPLDWAWTGGGMRVNPAAVWRTQPAVRKVIGFIAKNVASVPLNVFDRVSDTERRRVHDGPLAAVVGCPRERVAPYRFWEAVISDWLLYDRWAALVVPTEDGTPELVHVPSWRLWLETDAFNRVTGARMWTGTGTWNDDEGWQALPLDSLIFDHGYAPSGAGVSPMETLADILAEQVEQVRYNRQIWENGARVPLILKRPKDAPEWSNEARRRFADNWRAHYTNNGPGAGGTPVIEDGMEPHELKSFTAKDMQAVEGRQLTDIEVASAFHVAPEMIGAREGNYGSLRELRRRLFQIDLAPYITAWEAVLNAQLVPLVGAPGRLYVEANVEAKMRGDFFEQAEVKTRAVGGPWMTRNEARALENRPPIEGGDQLITPLNVTEGGMASPADTGSQNITEGNRTGEGKARTLARVKARPSAAQRRQVAELLAEFFARQGRTVASRLGAGAEWWDGERWDRELGDELFPVFAAISQAVGQRAVRALGFDVGEWDQDRTLAYWRKVSGSIAEAINLTTYEAVESALDGAEDAVEAANGVFAEAAETRAETAGVSASTMAAGFATAEAARQLAARHGGKPTKTWRVTSDNPRPSHAEQDGVTIPVDEEFPNGLMWPGDSGRGTVDEVAGCRCELDIEIFDEEAG